MYILLIGNFNESLMELGETICTPQNPSCEICPINKYCFAYHEVLNFKNKKKENFKNFLNQENKHIITEKEIEYDNDIKIKEKNNEIKKEKEIENNIVDNKIKEKNNDNKKKEIEIEIEDKINEGENETDLCKICEEVDDIIESVTIYPLKIKKNPLKEEFVEVCIIESTNNIQNSSESFYLVIKRPNNVKLANLWEFPQIIISHNNYITLESYLEDILGLKTFDFIEKIHLGTITHLFTHIKQVIYFFFLF